MIRVGLALLVTLGTLVMPFPVEGQRPTPRPGVTVVLSTSSTAASVRLAAFHQGLGELGYVDGENVVIDARSWLGEARPLGDLAADVARSGPAVIVAEGNPALAALKHATQSIPIVMSVVGDPVGSGFVASLARPGGNITGLSNTAEQLSGKRLELLKELVPGLARVAALRNPTNRTHAILLGETQAAAQTLGITLAALDFAGEGDLDGAFAAMVRDRIQAVIVLPQPLAVALRRPIADRAVRHRLPAMFPSPEPVEAGGLVSYGPSHTELWRRAASYVDRILKGARPADLPIEQPSRFDLVLNVKTARTLGLTIPLSLRLRANQTIE
ncbi:MAG TPA: ABC transporter substrate-binding protein [Methylomirabilota bacterium]|nr:ABC transporter substrate-binding protein [Methylomirabilota bacterium]